MASELPYGRKRALEIATTIALEPRMLLLDEPMAGLAPEDIGRISALIGRVAGHRQVLMREPTLSQGAALSARIPVPQRGPTLADGPDEAVSRDPRLGAAGVGTAHACP